MNARTAMIALVSKLAAAAVFLVTSMAGCTGAFVASSAVFFPEQTVFPNGVPPSSFALVAVNRAAKGDEAFRVVWWNQVPAVAAKDPDAFRLPVMHFAPEAGDPWRFSVSEQTASSQVIDLEYRSFTGYKTRYKVEGSRITPISYKADGGIEATAYLIPVFLLCLWLAWIAARRSSRWVAGRLQGSLGP